MGETRSFRTLQNASEVQSETGVRGRTELDERVNDEGEREPQGGEAERASEEEGRWLNVNS